MSALKYRTPTGYDYIEIPVSRADPVHEPQARYRRTLGGVLRASYPAATPWGRAWEFETPPLARAVARQLEVLLAIPGTGTADGLLFDAPTGVIATVLARSESGQGAGHVTVRFRLAEVEPVTDQRDLALLDIGAGLGIADIVCTRASTARAVDEDGVVQSFVADAVRVPHFVEG